MSAVTTEARPSVVLVTGPSGAGRSTAIDALEDLGFEAIDNMPLSLLPRLFETSRPHGPLALGVDPRNRDFSVFALTETIDTLSRFEDLDLQVLYLDCQVDTLIRRFSETRRRHPMSPEHSPLAGIKREQEMLVPIQARADILIDTTALTPHDLRRELSRWFMPEGKQGLSVTVHSFSYKRGIPRGVDMVFDCRFLQNPYWEPALRSLNGTDPAVANYVKQDARFEAFQTHVLSVLDLVLPGFAEEGKSYAAIGFGCTGGQHRSVTMAESIQAGLAPDGWRVSVRHRELERTGEGTPVAGYGVKLA